MTLSEELQWRGLIHQTTIKDITQLDTQKFTFYWGCDPSSDSLTIGNLAAGMLARRFREHGHKAVLLVGGATGMIGDPKDTEERALKSIEEINTNKAAIAKQYKAIFSDLDFDLVDNYDWFKDINYLDFLRNIGKQYSMTQLLDREFVKARVGDRKVGLSYAEFSYSLIQGYDFLHLFRNKGVTLQLCGADQWGNSISGVDLIRKLEGKEAHVFSAPLVVNKITGVKFGKTEEGAIWLDEAKTSVFKFYQFWLNTDDETVIDLLKIYSHLSEDEIANLTIETKDQPEARTAQKALAFDVTKTVHGEKRAKAVESISGVLFSNESFNELSAAGLDELANEFEPISAQTIVGALVTSKLATSNSEAVRLLNSGAISINGVKVTDEAPLINFKKNNGLILIKRGKNSFALIKA